MAKETERPSLQAQVTAVELAYVNANGSTDILRGLVAKGKRPQSELTLAEMNLPPLRQAWLTMQFIEANADKIRAATTRNPDDPY